MLIRFLIVLTLSLTVGCTGNDDTKVVDFSRTIEVARPETKKSEQQPLRVAVAAMVSPRETFVYYREILDYIGTGLRKDVQLTQRKTYAEINELLGLGEIDLAFLCSGPYALEKEKYGFELLATPEVNGSHFYQAYLIVNETSPFTALDDLKGKTFAFTDPHSNTGKLVPCHWLATIHERPESFFSKTIYTYSHDNSIMAVAKGMVDGASVDGLIWEYYHRSKPAITSRTRIIKKSEDYGIPPLVASRTLSSDMKKAVSRLLFSMHQDPQGRKILNQLMIDRFVEPQESWYDSIRAMLLTKSDSSLPDDHACQEPQK
jgi:phosphonate transport system substrate-binding protein